MNYCLQCCSDNKGVPDYWELSCIQYTNVAPKTNLYGYELRIARLLTLTDTEVIRCPIKRTACSYNESNPNQVIECVADDTMLWGITVEFWVTIRSVNFQSWRSVEKCSVTVDERTELLPNGAPFAENYILYHSRHPQSLSAFDGTLYSLICLLSIYLFLYYLRKDRCIICDKKLVIFCKRCYLCRFYGAYPPDPLLTQAMEEKGKYLQGEFPSKLAGLNTCSKCCYNIYSFFKCIFNSIIFIGKMIQTIFLCICCCQWINYCKCFKNKQINPNLETNESLSSDPSHQQLTKTLELTKNNISKSLSFNKYESPEQETLINHGKNTNNNMKDDIDQEDGRLLLSPSTKKRFPSSKNSMTPSLASSSNPTAPGGIKAPKRLKKNPNIIHVHPYFIYKALDHPHPPPAPQWVQNRRLDPGYEVPESVNDR